MTTGAAHHPRPATGVRVLRSLRASPAGRQKNHANGLPKTSAQPRALRRRLNSWHSRTSDRRHSTALPNTCPRRARADSLRSFSAEGITQDRAWSGYHSTIGPIQATIAGAFNQAHEEVPTGGVGQDANASTPDEERVQRRASSLLASRPTCPLPRRSTVIVAAVDEQTATSMYTPAARYLPAAVADGHPRSNVAACGRAASMSSAGLRTNFGSA